MALPQFKILGNPDTYDEKTYPILLGKAQFTEDYLAGKKLWGACKHATIAHANIRSIDASKALQVPGIKAVLTYEDCPQIFSREVLFWGQPIVGIVADDWYKAQRAINLIDVDYEELPAITDPDEAFSKGDAAPLSGKRAESNIAIANHDRGNIENAVAQADLTVSYDQYWTTTHQHGPIEQYQATAYWLNDHCYVYQSSQACHGNQIAVVNYLETTANKVHCISRHAGTGHGARLSNWESGVAAYMSKAVNGAPVHFKCSKKHSMLFRIRQHDHRSKYTWSVKNDGTILGADVEYYTNGTGAGINTVFQHTWNIPNVRWRGKGAYINVPDRGAWRCVSDPPNGVQVSTALDKLAAELDMNPYELRKKNIMPVDMPALDPPNYYFAAKEVNECFETVAQESGYLSKWHKPGENNVMDDGRLHGIGIHCHHDSHGSVAAASNAALVLMKADGTCVISVGCTGIHNTTAQSKHFVAEVMGLKFEHVSVGDWANTDVTLDTGRHGGSTFTGAQSTFVTASLDARAKVFAIALTKAPFKDIAGITVDDLDAEDSEIFYTKDPSQRMSYRTAMSGAPGIAGYGIGWAAAGGGHAGGGLQRSIHGLPVGTKVNTTSGCASVVEVAVDPETGEVEVLGHWNAVGTGRVVFRKGVLNQIGSGSELQICQALYYGDVYDPLTGAVISSQYTEAQLPTTLDCKPSRHTLLPVEGDDHAGPLGAHGIGEPCVGSYACIMTAIFNATGKWVDTDHGAANPDRVLKALGKA